MGNYYSVKDLPESKTKFTSVVSKVFNVTKTKPESRSALSNGLLNFTNDLCKIFVFDEQLKENYVCSTLSAYLVLSMAAYGADNNTAVEMKKVLHIAGDECELLENYQNLIDRLNPEKNIVPKSENDIDSPTSRLNRMVKEHESVVTLANKIYVAKDMKVKEEYENVLDLYFRSKSETLDFSKSDESAEVINKWCSESTNGKIKKIITPDELDQNTTLILTNAVYFKGNWQPELWPAKPEMFHLDMHNKIEVPTMYQTGELLYKNLSKLNAQAVRLEFMGGHHYMDIIVPNEIDGLRTIQRNLNAASEIEYECRYVSLWLPKFQVESKIEFNNYLHELGMVEAFNGRKADFKKICDRNVHIQTVVQKAFIKVDEIGCEAAAFSWAALVDVSGRLGEAEHMIVIADRPFLFRIMDAKLKIPLFIGSIVNPQQ